MWPNVSSEGQTRACYQISPKWSQDIALYIVARAGDNRVGMAGLLSTKSRLHTGLDIRQTQGCRVAGFCTTLVHAKVYVYPLQRSGVSWQRSHKARPAGRHRGVQFTELGISGPSGRAAARQTGPRISPASVSSARPVSVAPPGVTITLMTPAAACLERAPGRHTRAGRAGRSHYWVPLAHSEG